MKRWSGRADFTVMSWDNGKGVTQELARAEDAGGRMLWRLSRAKVVEEGPFSLFPGVERNLTVLTGPGFDLVGEGLHLAARPLVPVAFPGDLPVRAVAVTGPSDDFNVMTSRSLPAPKVWVLTGAELLPEGGLLALYWPQSERLLLTDEPFGFDGQETAIAVRILMPAA